MKIKDIFVSKEEFFKLPNELTLFRILLTPIILVAILYNNLNWAFYSYVLAVITDFFDGYIARKRKEVTNLGKIMDPLADKFLSIILYVSLSIKTLGYINVVPLWLTVFIVAKDIIIVSGVVFLFLLKENIIIKVNIYGKLSTVFQDFTIFMVLLFNFLKKPCDYLLYLYLITLIITLIAAYSYIKLGFKILAEEVRE
jgi:cardiolipin synthase